MPAPCAQGSPQSSRKTARSPLRWSGQHGRGECLIPLSFQHFNTSSVASILRLQAYEPEAREFADCVTNLPGIGRKLVGFQQAVNGIPREKRFSAPVVCGLYMHPGLRQEVFDERL